MALPKDIFEGEADKAAEAGASAEDMEKLVAKLEAEEKEKAKAASGGAAEKSIEEVMAEEEAAGRKEAAEKIYAKLDELIGQAADDGMRDLESLMSALDAAKKGSVDQVAGEILAQVTDKSARAFVKEYEDAASGLKMDVTGARKDFEKRARAALVSRLEQRMIKETDQQEVSKLEKLLDAFNAEPNSAEKAA